MRRRSAPFRLLAHWHIDEILEMAKKRLFKRKYSIYNYIIMSRLHIHRKVGDFPLKNDTATLSTSPISIRLFGGFSMERDGKILTDDINRSQKLWSVLAYLVIHRDRDIPQTEFIEQFWQEENSANPASALKTLLYRIRAMIEPLFGEDTEAVISRRGSYSWNRALSCEVDTDLFEELCLRAASPNVEGDEQLTLLRRATELYKGMLLPKLSDQIWLMPMVTRLHSHYVAAVKEMFRLLVERGLYDELAALCLRASELDPMDESLHIMAIRALLFQGRNSAALSHYENATEMLYRSLGVRPSEELRELYSEIMSVEKGMETDLEVIQSDLREAACRPGAYVCEYGFFQEAYRLEARRSSRNGTCVHIVLLTVSQPDGSIPPLKQLNLTMDQLLVALQTQLRSGDVVSRYSAAQYVVMLPSANYENSRNVMDRIISAFYRQHRHNFLKITYKIREVE